MVGGTKGGGDNHIALGGAAQAFFFGESIKALENFGIDTGRGFFQNSLGSARKFSIISGHSLALRAMVGQLELQSIHQPPWRGFLAKGLVENGGR